MAQIPVPAPTVSSRSTRPDSNDFLSQNASADSFGAAGARGLQIVGNAVSGLTREVGQQVKQARQEAVAAGVAQSDFGPTLEGIRKATPPSGTGYHDAVLNAYDQYVDTQAAAYDDAEARKQYKTKMMAQRNGIANDAASYEAARGNEYSIDQANKSLDALTTRISQTPQSFDSLVSQGYDVLDARGDINPTLRDAMKTSWLQHGANARFEGMLNAATTPAEADALAADLADPKQGWQDKFDPQQYEVMLNKIGTVRNAMRTAADTNARAALDTIEDRNKGLVPIPPEELDIVQQVVKQSQNPITQSRMARIIRDQDIIDQSKSLPPAELQAQINAANSQPGAAYPGMPPVVSDAINQASSTFGISAAYLGGTINREYGAYLKSDTKVNKQFTPQAISGNTDLRDLRPEVLNAATVAGENFGAPLQIFSGYRSQGEQDAIIARGDPNRPDVAKDSYHTKGDALDISTAGMSDADKGRLTSSLVDAGFTGIGEYDTHIHADMRSTVPATYGERDGQTWGGWTYLSPAVAQSLAEHGYAPGATADKITRKNAVPTSDSIDYTHGNDTSSAKGLLQITDDTFVRIMADPARAKRIGVDTTGMSQEDILKLRDDPKISVMAAAALAEKNKADMELVLGRTISDPELYMGHFLGIGGALQLIQAVKNDPNADVTKMMPQAAEANRNVFYNGDKPLTAQQLYDKIALNFITAPSQVSYGDNQTRQSILDKTTKALKDDPMQFAGTNGVFNVLPLDSDQNFAARGQSARAVADFYSIPIKDMKPFTDDEANALVKQMDSGTAEDAMGVMSRVAALGGDMAKSGFTQIGEKDPAMGYAASLAYDRGQVATAEQIVQGNKIIKENPSIKDSIGATPADVSKAFQTATGSSLALIDPSSRQAIQDAAFAYYAADAVQGGSAGFDAAKFGDAVQAVMGADNGTEAVAEVNGAPTVLPKDVTAETLNTAINRMTDNDWITLSPQKTAPHTGQGEPLSASVLADEAKLVFIGGGQYRVQLADGGYAVVSPTEAYIFQPDAKTLTQIATRPQAEQERLYGEKGIYGSGGRQTRNLFGTGSNGHLDENGRWIANE